MDNNSQNTNNPFITTPVPTWAPQDQSNTSTQPQNPTPFHFSDPNTESNTTPTPIPTWPLPNPTTTPPAPSVTEPNLSAPQTSPVPTFDPSPQVVTPIMSSEPGVPMSAPTVEPTLQNSSPIPSPDNTASPFTTIPTPVLNQQPVNPDPALVSSNQINPVPTFAPAQETTFQAPTFSQNTPTAQVLPTNSQTIDQTASSQTPVNPTPINYDSGINSNPFAPATADTSNSNSNWANYLNTPQPAPQPPVTPEPSQVSGYSVPGFNPASVEPSPTALSQPNPLSTNQPNIPDITQTQINPSEVNPVNNWPATNPVLQPAETPQINLNNQFGSFAGNTKTSPFQNTQSMTEPSNSTIPAGFSNFQNINSFPNPTEITPQVPGTPDMNTANPMQTNTSDSNQSVAQTTNPYAFTPPPSTVNPFDNTALPVNGNIPTAAIPQLPIQQTTNITTNPNITNPLMPGQQVNTIPATYPSPVDFSQLTPIAQGSGADDVYTPSIQATNNTGLPAPTPTLPPSMVTQATPMNKSSFPKPAIFAGVLVAFVAVAASAYFFLGIGKTGEPLTTASLPVQEQAPLTNPPKQINRTDSGPSAVAAATDEEASVSASPAPSDKPSALDQLKNRQTPSPAN